MKKYILLIILSLNISCFAEPQLSYDKLWEQVLNSFSAIKIASENIAISALSVKQTESELQPKITMQSYTEYTKDLESDTGDIISIGGTTLGDQTKVQNTLSIKARTPLMTFGKEYFTYMSAKYDYIDTIFNYYKSLTETQLNFLDIYKNYWLSDLNVQRDTQLVLLSEKLSKVTNKLYDAGKVSLVDVIDNDYLNKQHQLLLKKNKSQQKLYINKLSFYTNHQIMPQNVTYNYYRNADVILKNKYENSISYMAYNNKKDSLLLQYSQQQTQTWPSFYLYSQMSYYGSDKERLDKSINNMDESNFAVGIQGDMTIFDGFNNLYQIQKTKKEIELIDLEIINDQKNYFFALKETSDQIDLLTTEIAFLNQLIQNIKSKKLLMQKMDYSRLVSKDKYIESQIKEVEIEYSKKSSLAQLWLSKRKYSILAQQFEMKEILGNRKYLINRNNDFIYMEN